MKTMALFILRRWGDARAAIDSVRLTGGARATTSILSKWTNDGAVRALRGIAAAKKGGAGNSVGFGAPRGSASAGGGAYESRD